MSILAFIYQVEYETSLKLRSYDQIKDQVRIQGLEITIVLEITDYKLSVKFDHVLMVIWCCKLMAVSFFEFFFELVERVSFKILAMQSSTCIRIFMNDNLANNNLTLDLRDFYFENPFCSVNGCPCLDFFCCLVLQYIM